MTVGPNPHLALQEMLPQSQNVVFFFRVNTDHRHRYLCDLLYNKNSLDSTRWVAVKTNCCAVDFYIGLSALPWVLHR